MFKFFGKAITVVKAVFGSNDLASANFVENYVIPDMLSRGFGFGRSAVGSALVKLGITKFSQIDTLTPDQIAFIQGAPKVGPKVFYGFRRYLASRGNLPGVTGEEVVQIIVDDPSET